MNELVALNVRNWLVRVDVVTLVVIDGGVGDGASCVLVVNVVLVAVLVGSHGSAIADGVIPVLVVVIVGVVAVANTIICS